MSLLQRSIFVCFLGLALLGGTGAGARSPDNPRQEGRVPGRGKGPAAQLEAQQRELEALRLRERDLVGEMRHLESIIETRQVDLSQREKRLEEARARLLEQRKRREALRTQLRGAEERMQVRLRALYKYARRGYLGFLMGASGLDQFRRRATYVMAVLREDRNLLARLDQERKEYARQAAGLKEEMARDGRRLDEERHRFGVLKADLQRKVHQLVQIRKEKTYYEEAVEKLQKAGRDLRRRLSALPALEGRRRSATGFSSAKGRLHPPMGGRLVRLSKQGFLGRRAGGVFIEGGDGRVKAVFSGTVAFSGRIRGYGEMIIIDHGDRFFTVSAYLAERAKEAGEPVEQGETIGRAGLGGPEPKPRVYFEIRKAGQVLNPFQWLAREG